MSKRPNIEHYLDYSVYLREFFTYMQSSNPSVTQTTLAERAGVGSRSLLNLILNGKRRLRPGMVNNLSIALGLDASERHFLHLLIEYKHETNRSARVQVLRDMVRRKGFRSYFQLDAKTLDLLANWWTAAILELVDSPEFEADPKWITKKIYPKVSHTDVVIALDALVSSGALAFEGGHYKRTADNLRAPDLLQEEVSKLYHGSVCDLAKTIAETVPQNQRRFGTVVARMNEQSFEELCDRVETFRLSLYQFVQDNFDPDADQVAQVNLQAFWVTTPGGEP